MPGAGANTTSSSSDGNRRNGTGHTRTGGAAAEAAPLYQPPQDIEAEQATLGAMLLGDPTAIDTAAEMLAADDFYRIAHGEIFEAMLSLHGRSEPVDSVTLKDELIRRDLYERIGGTSYLMALGDVVPTTANIAYYARIVQEKANLRRLITVCAQISGLAYRGERDAADIQAEAEQSIFAAGSGAAGRAQWKRLGSLLSAEMEAIEERGKAGTGLTGISTGLVRVDAILSGLRPSDLMILAARPSMGKSACAMSMAAHVARQGGKVAVFSLEMSAESLTQRLLAAEARVDLRTILRGALTVEEWERTVQANQRLYEAPLAIDDTTDVTPSQLRARARRLRAEMGGMDLVVVDYLQYMRPDEDRRMGSRNDEITQIVQGLKSLAREMRCPVLALSQLSRAVERREDKRPMLSDLRDSGSVEAEADAVAMLYRPSYYARRKEDEEEDHAAVPAGPEPEVDEVEFIVAKQRNGPVGTVKLAFLPRYTLFADLEETRY